MGVTHGQAGPTLYLPPVQLSIAPAAHQLVSQRIPDDGRDLMGLPFKGAHALPVAGLPEEQFPAASATTPTGEPGAVGTPGHCRDPGAVLVEGLEQHTIAGSPQTDAPVIPTTGQAAAIPPPPHATNKAQNSI